MATLTFNETLESLHCSECSIHFAFPDVTVQRRRNDGQTFYCPHGHMQHFSESKIDRLEREKKELADKLARETSRLDQERARRTAEEASHAGTRKRLAGTQGVVTRYKRRITAGSCVCCSRKFRDLEKHMKDKHPDWNPDKHADALAAKAEI